MSPEVRSTVTLLVGLVTLRLATSGLMLNYLRPGMRPYLLASAVFLCVIGAVGFLRATRPRLPVAGLADDHGGHDHPPSRAAWLLLIPMLSVVLIAPDPLGAFAAGRQSSLRTDLLTGEFGPMPDPVDGAVELTLRDFTDRALYDTDGSLEGVTVRLIGFVSPAGPSDGADFAINRFLITCCAADARAMEVQVYGAAPPRVDAWVEATGTWRRSDGSGSEWAPPSLDVTEVKPIPQPEVPYETY